jgi:tripartite-type tricarboxylate transporter receptor subunit TctC
VKRLLAFVVIISLYWFSAATQALAAAPFDEKAVADFYRGKTVRIIVGFSAGGGYDA